MMALLGGLLAVAMSLQVATSPHYRIDCDAAAHYSERARGVAFLVVQDGQVVCERYARGTGPDDAWDLASGTKSLTAMMAAIAVQDGLFTLDTPVADIVGDVDTPPGLTIRTLLHQSSGLVVPRTVRRIPAYDDALRTRVEFPPGERFVYGPVHFEAFGAVLQHALDARGMDVNPGEYLVRRILAPVGGRIESWRAVDGAPALSEGARMTARDWARFGLVALREGRVGAQPLADAPTVRAMFAPGDANGAYGLGWWLPRPAGHAGRAVWPDWLQAEIRDEDFPVVAMAAGAGGQRLYLFPQLDLVVVRLTRGVPDDPATRTEPWSDRRFLHTLVQWDD